MRGKALIIIASAFIGSIICQQVPSTLINSNFTLNYQMPLSLISDNLNNRGCTIKMNTKNVAFICNTQKYTGLVALNPLMT